MLRSGTTRSSLTGGALTSFPSSTHGTGLAASLLGVADAGFGTEAICGGRVFIPLRIILSDVDCNSRAQRAFRRRSKPSRSSSRPSSISLMPSWRPSMSSIDIARM